MLAHRELMTQIDIRPVILPVDLATGANAGIWQPVRNFARVAFVFFADPGTADQDPILTLRQATDGTGTGAKNAAIITKVYRKQHGSVLPSDWTVDEQAAGATYTHVDGGETVNLYVVEVDPAKLDIANGFDWITVDVADPGAAAGKLGACLFLGLRARYASDRPATAA